MPSSSAPTAVERLFALPASAPALFTTSDIVRLVEVAKKYQGTEEALHRVPEYTHMGGPNSYHCTENKCAWTQGFFPSALWILVERDRLIPGTLEAAGYTEDEVIALARRYQLSYRNMARPAVNHDQGFRFQLPYGRDLELTGNKDTIPVLIEAAESLVDRYDPKVGCIRSWDVMVKAGKPDDYRLDNLDEHYLVIIDNMMNLDLMYQVTELTGDKKYADIATRQAEMMQVGHIRPDYTTYHVVDYGAGGNVKWQGTHQGYSDSSCWSRGQAWGMYGYAQCAQRTGRTDFLQTSRDLTDAFLQRLPESGVPWWDFDAPKPCPYDASAGTIAARAMQMLYCQLVESDPVAAEHYLDASFKLLDDIMRECATPAASVKDRVDWGEGGWETILKHSTINNNPDATFQSFDTGLVYADMYLVEAANEAIKLKALAQKYKRTRM